MTDLPNCPFCGNTENLEVDFTPSETTMHFVMCRECGAEGPYDFGESGAIEAWKQRPIEAALTARIAELEEAQRWIPVEERLPETNIRVDILRTCPDGYDYQNGCYIANNNYWWSEILACKLLYVTHWRPLPEPTEVNE